MGILEGPVICRPSVYHGKQARISAPVINTILKNTRHLRSGFWGSKTRCRNIIRVGALSIQPCERKGLPIRCGFSSSSDGNGSMAGNFNENDEDYVNSSVIEAGNLFELSFFFFCFFFRTTILICFISVRFFIFLSLSLCL